MKVEIKKFGDILISRPSGLEASRVFAAYFKPSSPNEIIELDFSGVVVLAPSWIDEFVTQIKDHFQNPISFAPSANASVVESLKFLTQPPS